MRSVGCLWTRKFPLSIKIYEFFKGFFNIAKQGIFYNLSLVKDCTLRWLKWTVFAWLLNLPVYQERFCHWRQLANPYSYTFHHSSGSLRSHWSLVLYLYIFIHLPRQQWIYTINISLVLGPLFIACRRYIGRAQLTFCCWVNRLSLILNRSNSNRAINRVTAVFRGK